MSSVPRVTKSRSRRAGALVASGATLLAVSVVGFAPNTAVASSHREAPLTAGDPLADNTDVYMFVSPDKPDTVTMIADWIPFEEPNGGPNFYPFGTGAGGYFYDINIDSNGDGKPDIVYRWTFSTQDNRGKDTFLYNNGPVTSLDDPHLLFRQTYNLTVSKDGGKTFPDTIVANAKVAPSNVGPGSMPNYDKDLFRPAITPVTGPGGGQSYAGQADDPFFLDLRVFDLLYGGNLKEVGQDTLAGYNVNTVALQLPKSAVALNGDSGRNPVVGVWSTTSRQSADLATGKSSGGPMVQVSRLGQPLVNELIVPTGLKDAFNNLTPDKDATVQPVVDRVFDPEVPKLVETIYKLPAPKAPRNDIAEIFLTGVTTKLDGGGFFKSPGSKAPIAKDLNSQLLNADSADPKKFQPSEMTRLNMSIPPTANPQRLGVAANDLAGFPNGRRLTDDVVDIELAALGGFFVPGQSQQSDALTKAGFDGVNANNKPFNTSFPYVASPNNQAVNQGAKASSSGMQMPAGGVETGVGGGSGASTLPLVSGAAAVLLLGAGGASLYSGRRRRAGAAEGSTSE